MGNFYTNITLVGEPKERAVDALTQQGRAAFVGSWGGHAVVFDEAGDSQDGSHVALAESLSKALGCTSLAVLNHDDDVLWLQVFDGGELVGDYNSWPDYFEDSDDLDGDEFDEGEPHVKSGGSLDGAALAAAFGAADADRVAQILTADYVFAVERHGHLAEALGLPKAACGFGYTAIDRGDLPPGDELARVPG